FGQRLLDGTVTCLSVRSEVRSYMNGAGSDLAGHARDDLDRVTFDDQQTAVQALVQGPQASVQEPLPRRSGGREQTPIEHEQSQCASVAPRGEKSRLIGHAKVTTEPHQRWAVIHVRPHVAV